MIPLGASKMKYWINKNWEGESEETKWEKKYI
jgi:hypothetical protein